MTMQSAQSKSMVYFDKVRKQTGFDDTELQKAFNFHRHLKVKLNKKQQNMNVRKGQQNSPKSHKVNNRSQIQHYGDQILKKL